MPSRNTYRLAWVSLTLDVGYLFTAAPVQSLLLTLDEGYLLTTTPPDLERGVAPLGPPVPTQPLLLAHAAPGRLKNTEIQSLPCFPGNTVL